METVSTKKRASAAQVRYFEALFTKAGLVLASSRLRRFKAMTMGQASLEIQRVATELKAHAVADYRAPAGMATAKQLSYFSKLKHRLGEPVTPLEIDNLKTLTTAEMAMHTSITMQRLQHDNDANGVPLPLWRLERGLYNPDDLRDGQRRAAARQADRRTEIEMRIRARQESTPGRREIYPGEFI